MATSRQGRLQRAAFGTLLVLAAGAFVAQDASAQGLFSSLFGGFSHNDRESGGWNRRDDWGRGGWGRRDYGEERYQRRSAYAPASPTLDGRFPIPDFSVHPQRRSVDAAPRNSGVHCVRLCDGRHFPLPRSSAGGAKLDPVKVCSALCPAAKTQVFQGSNMEHAVASDGTRYADLDEAFTYRDKIVPDCSCTGHGPGGLAQIDIESDPTLRAGDVVVTASGPSIFRGSASFPYKTADFTPVGDYGRINAQLREKLSTLKVNHTVMPVMPPQKIATGGTDSKPVRQKRRRVTVHPAPHLSANRPQFQAWWR